MKWFRDVRTWFTGGSGYFVPRLAKCSCSRFHTEFCTIMYFAPRLGHLQDSFTFLKTGKAPPEERCEFVRTCLTTGTILTPETNGGFWMNMSCRDDLTSSLTATNSSFSVDLFRLHVRDPNTSANYTAYPLSSCPWKHHWLLTFEIEGEVRTNTIKWFVKRPLPKLCKPVIFHRAWFHFGACSKHATVIRCWRSFHLSVRAVLVVGAKFDHL